MHPVIDVGDLDGALAQAADGLRRAKRVAALTGAGVSAESGLATFRGGGGLWEGRAVEDVATPEAFQRNPGLVWRFYNLRRAGLRSARPNAGHLALVDLEKRWGERFTLITQNVDGLHQAAGSGRVLELHGGLARVRCTGCKAVTQRAGEALPDLPSCDACGALLRPDVVWFHEMLPESVWRVACEAVEACDCFLVIGTSAVVYPAAGLIDMARALGACVIEVNLEPAAIAAGLIGLYGPSGQVLPRLIKRLDESAT
ncbi:MAG TPA: NAD-dependent deacylase [Gemmataceae bacterium]|nr:NAD-dependent deacylase [Gemmataceae bacterium]